MIKNIIILIAFILSCCKSDDKQLSDVLLSKLVEYQKKYPYYNQYDKGKAIIYTAMFIKKNNDTLLQLCRSSNGVIPELKGYGIFKNDELKETFIYDEFNLSEKFIKNKILKIDKQNYFNIEGSFDESFPPIHTYVVRNKELHLIKIDTIWKHWK
jgi:hypothetical protein